MADIVIIIYIDDDKNIYIKFIYLSIFSYLFIILVCIYYCLLPFHSFKATIASKHYYCYYYYDIKNKKYFYSKNWCIKIAQIELHAF